MSLYTDTACVTDVDLGVEIEEREEQVYETDGSPMMAQKEADEDAGLDKAHKIRVKLKRYYYRIRATVTTEQRIVNGSLATPPAVGSDIADTSNNDPGGAGVSVDGVHYICTNERMRLVDGTTTLYVSVVTWTGFTKWKKVPSAWKMNQSTEAVGEGEDSHSGN